MNLILLDTSDFISESCVQLEGSRLVHIQNVHGSKIGDTVRVGQLGGLVGSGTITELGQDKLTLEVKLNQQPPTKLPLSIILALPRPKMIRRIFRTVAELGVKRLHVINSYRVEKSFWQSPAINEHNVHQYLIEGLQQAKDTVLPQVSFHKRFKPFVEDELPGIIKNSKSLLAHPGLGESCPHQLNQPVTLAIGPEGGFIPYEVEKLQETGFDGIHLGKRILKVENALTTLIAKLYS